MTVKVADKAWIATALLHRENPDKIDFAAKEIRRRAMREFQDSDQTKSVWYHILTHCVAEKKANPGNYRMLHETGRGRRRLYVPGDPVHGDRTGKQVPNREEIPQRYWELLDWYESDFVRKCRQESSTPTASTLKRDGSGKNWLQFVGYIDADDLRLMAKAIEENCEQVFPE